MDMFFKIVTLLNNNYSIEPELDDAFLENMLNLYQMNMNNICINK